MVVAQHSKKVRVAIVEDHPMFRERLTELINKERDMLVCGEADNIRDGFELVANGGATIAIIDITLKGSSGLELIKNLRGAGVGIPLLVLSMHDESLYAERALRAGARGYITKHAASSKIMTALRRVVSGEVYLAEEITSKLLGNLAGGRHRELSGLERLTDRELEVFGLLGRGRTTAQISAELSLGGATVETYRARIKEKLQLGNAAELRSEAARWVYRTQQGSSEE